MTVPRWLASLIRDTPLPFQELTEEAHGRTPIPPRLDEDVDHITVLVDGPPDILLPPLNADEQFVQVPASHHLHLTIPYIVDHHRTRELNQDSEQSVTDADPQRIVSKIIAPPKAQHDAGLTRRDDQLVNRSS